MDPISVVAGSAIESALVARQTIRRPFDLFKLYGLPGIVLFFFASRTVWRTEAHVLGSMLDDDANNFKKSVQDECTMISVAVRSTAQMM